MGPRFSKFCSLAFVSVFAVAGGVAHADNINSSGVVCQHFNASQALDIDYLANGVRNINASERQVICSVPRSPLALGQQPFFSIDGRNLASTSTSCTVTAYSVLSEVLQTVSFVEPAVATTAQWSHTVQFPVGSVGTFAYVSVLCKLPGNGNGMITGVTSIQ